MAKVKRTEIKILWLIVFYTIAISACANDQNDEGKSEDWRRGKAVYLLNCTACHNRDPSKEGSIGPVVAGASKELLEALLLRGQYPSGYKPKQPTKVMPSFPFLKSEIPYLVIYLGSDANIQ